MKNLSSSRFEDWTRQELVMLLVHRGVELRGEAAIASQTLIDMAEEAFYGEPLPDKPRNFTIWELLKLSWAVAKVQDVWIEKIYRRRMERINKQEFFDDGEGGAPQSYTAMHSLDSAAGDPGDVDNEAALMSVKDHDFIHGHTSEMRRKAGDNSRLGLTAMKHTRKQAIDSHLEKARPVSMITNAMKIPWVGPDWEKARVHADYVNPRKGGKGGKGGGGRHLWRLEQNNAATAAATAARGVLTASQRACPTHARSRRRGRALYRHPVIGDTYYGTFTDARVCGSCHCETRCPHFHGRDRMRIRL